MHDRPDYVTWTCRVGFEPGSAPLFTERQVRVAFVPSRVDLEELSALSFSSLTTMFPSSSTFPTTTTGTGQDQRQQFPHSHSHPVQYNGSPFNVAGMSNLNQSTASPNVRGGSLGMSMGSSLGMGSPLSESLSQSRSHYQSGYLMVCRSSFTPPTCCLTSLTLIVCKPEQRESSWDLAFKCK